MNDTTRSLVRNILFFVVLLIIAIVLFYFLSTFPAAVGTVWVIPSWLPNLAVFLVLVTTYAYWSVGNSLLRRREQNLKKMVAMPATIHTTTPTTLPDSIVEADGHLKRLGFAALGEVDDFYLETLDRHPAWAYSLPGGTILAWVMKHPMAQQANIALASTFPDGFELRTAFPRTVVVNTPDYTAEFRTDLDEAVRYHSTRLEQLRQQHGQPLSVPTLEDAVRLDEQSKPRIIPALGGIIQDRWRKLIVWSSLAGLAAAVLSALAWASGLFLLVIIALVLSGSMISYLLIQIVFVIQITRMNTPQPESS